MDNVPDGGLNQEAHALPVVGGPAALPWTSVLCCVPGATPGTSLLGQTAEQLPGQQQQQFFYNHSIPVFPSFLTFAGHAPVLGVSTGHTAVTAQQLQFNCGAIAVQPTGCTLQVLQPHQQQVHKCPPGQASSAEEDTALCDLLTNFEEQQNSRQGNLQHQALNASESAGLERRDEDDFLENLYEQQRIARQLQQQSRQQGTGPAHRQPAAAETLAAGMDAPYPYQTVYGNQQQNGSMMQQHLYLQRPTSYHPGPAVAYNYGHLPPPHQQQPPPHAPWATSWAVGVQRRHGEAPPGFAPVSFNRQSSGGSNLASGTGATAGQEQRPGQRSTSHRSKPSKHKPKQQSKQPPSTAGQTAAAGGTAGVTASKPGGPVVSRNSPEHYFRQHVALMDPFVGTATSDAVGLLAVTHLPPGSSQASASGMVMNSSLEIALSSCQMTMLRCRTAVLQLACLLVDDKVPYRCHWPCSASLMVNSQSVRHLYSAKRAPSMQLKPHQVDSPADISTLATPQTVVTLSYVSNSSGYVLGARLVRQQSMDRVKQMLGKEPSLIAAVAGVKKKLAGDGDVEVSVNAVSLRCPLTAMRIKTPAHFTTAPGLAHFDLDSFLELTQRSGKWQDPHSSALGNVSQVAVEPWLASIIKQLDTAALTDSVDEVEVNPDGSWRPKGSAVDTWFDVLHPPTPPQLREAFRGPAGHGIKRSRHSGDDDNAAVQQAKQQRCAADAAGAKGKNGCVDLTLDSDDEGDAALAAVRRTSAAVLLARTFMASSSGAGLPSESAGHTHSEAVDSDFAAFCQDLWGTDNATSGRNDSSRSARPVRIEHGSTVDGLTGSAVTRGRVIRRQTQKPSHGSQTSNAAAAFAGMRIPSMAPPAASRQHHQQHGTAGSPSKPTPAGAAAAEAEVIVIADSDSD